MRDISVFGMDGDEQTYRGDGDSTVFKSQISGDADRRTQLNVQSNIPDIYSAADNPFEKR
jgi:hypothetical protein